MRLSIGACRLFSDCHLPIAICRWGRPVCLSTSDLQVLFLLLAFGNRDLERRRGDLLEKRRIENVSLVDFGERRDEVLARRHRGDAVGAVARWTRWRTHVAWGAWRPVASIGREDEHEVLWCGPASGIEQAPRQ